MSDVVDLAAAPAAPLPPIARSPGRYLFVDALRGVAAVAVVLHHLLHTTVMDDTLHRVLPGWYLAVSEFGNRGVQVFFVISGFVIAHSVRGLVPDARGVANFAVRRQLRLDPPYFLVLALMLAETAVENRVPRFVHKPVPGPAAVLANLFYAQNVLGAPQVVGVAWTLCLEVQFYLLFVAATAIGYRASPARANPGPVAVWLVFASGLACLAAVRRQFVFVAWFPSFWPYFAFGAVAYWATHRLVPRPAFAAYAIGFAVATVLAGPIRPLMAVGLVTAVALYAAAETGHMRTWGRSAPLQYLGRVSYSLYLIHLPVLSVVLRGGYKLTGENRWAALGWYAVAAAAAFAAADVFHRGVERPSMRWAARLRPRSVAAAESKDVAASAGVPA